jgi:hypothetical protein
MQDTLADPIIITVAQTPAEELSIADVVLGSLGLAGALLVLALVLGVAVAAVRVGWNRAHRPEENHLPPVVGH